MRVGTARAGGGGRVRRVDARRAPAACAVRGDEGWGIGAGGRATLLIERRRAAKGDVKVNDATLHKGSFVQPNFSPQFSRQVAPRGFRRKIASIALVHRVT